MRQKKIKYKFLAISSIITIVMIAIAITGPKDISFQYLFTKLIIPIVRLLIFITIGLCIGQIIETLGWTKKMAGIVRPIFKFSNLGDRCGAAFISAFFSGVVANALLVDFFKDKKISKMQLFLTNYLNQLPAYFLHLPTTIFIVLPLTGFAGLIYFALTFSAVLIRFIVFIAFSKFYFLTSENHISEDISLLKKPEDYCNYKKSKKELVRTSLILKKLIPRMTAILIWVIPIYTFVFLLNSYEIFEYVNNLVSSKISTSILPVHSLSVVVISFAAEFTSGFAAAGALMDAGILSIKETVIALLLGNIIAFPIRALRHQIPRYLGIFSPKMGLTLLLSGQSFRIFSLIIVGAIYYVVG